MKAVEFCYWLQGFFEINFDCEPGAAPESLTAEQVMCIRKHLNLVFKHEIDPGYSNPEVLNAIHAGKPSPLTFDEVLQLMQEERPKMVKELKELIAEHEKKPHVARPHHDPNIRC